ncbi:MAG TPA: metallophosphoesterase, partial [Chitinophagaceae bacterium]
MLRRSFLQNIGAITGAAALPFSIDELSAKKPIRFAHLTDIHVKPGDIPEQGMEKAFYHVQALKQKPDFIINGGDAIMDALAANKQNTQQQFTLFKNILGRTNALPVYHCIGNHD